MIDVKIKNLENDEVLVDGVFSSFIAGGLYNEKMGVPVTRGEKDVLKFGYTNCTAKEIFASIVAVESAVKQIQKSDDSLKSAYDDYKKIKDLPLGEFLELLIKLDNRKEK